MAKVTALRSVEIGAGNMAQARAFYGGLFGLREVGEDGGVVFLRGTGSQHHALALHPAPYPCMIRVVLETTDRAAVDQICQNVRDWGGLTVEDPAEIDRIDGGYGFGFKDVEGRNFAVICDAKTHAAEPDDIERPTKLSHVNLNADDNPGSTELLMKALGMELRDETKIMRFMGCNDDHHSVVVAKSGGPTLNHISFELPNLEAVMLGTGRMVEAGYPIEWGIGRHGPGNNVFAYYAGPEEFPIEYCSEMSQKDETYVFKGPDEWKFPPGRSDQWGLCTGPTKRLKRIQRMMRFTEDGYKLHR